MNKIKYGLKSVHYATITEVDGTIAYGTPKPIKGAVNLVLNARGERPELYADDTLYFTTNTNNGYEGNLEVALVPDEFKKDVFGYKEDDNGILFEDANENTKNIALLFEFAGDVNAVRHVLYNVNPARPNLEGSSKNNTIEPKTESMAIVAMPATDTGLVKAKAEPTQSQYDAWYTTIYEYIEPVGV